jgi:NADH-quinone oxidoreductase subunit N
MNTTPPLTLSPGAVTKLWQDLYQFLPEIVLVAGIVLLLLMRLSRVFLRAHMGGFALGFTVIALGLAVGQWQGLPASAQGVASFARMVVYDDLTLYVRLLLLVFAALVILLTFLTRIPDAEESADFYVLLLGGVLGMMFMSSAYHLLMVYIAVEMASLPSYALAGFMKGQRRAGEAALKYVVYGGGASGIMLYGISLVAGRFGTGYLPDVARGVAVSLAAGGVDVPLALGLAFILIGLAFKLSAVPFHFWCPDVFEGAAAEIGAYLSVASKAAAMALTGRLVMTLVREAGPAAAPAFVPVLAIFAAVTATFGNLAAYPQNNLKRLLAYSTIAHAGYMLMGLSVVNLNQADGFASVLFYLATYLFTNLGAFAAVAFIRNRTGTEDLRDLRGLGRRSPGIVLALGVCLLSLLGLPPLVGFAAKFVVFSVLYHAADEAHRTGPAWLGGVYWSLLVIGGVNTAISAFYYLRVLKIMVLDRPEGVPADGEPAPLRFPPLATGYAGLMAAVVVVLGVGFGPLQQLSERGVTAFKRAAAVAALPQGGR